MKKTICAIITALLMLLLSVVCFAGDAEKPSVFVTIADGSGSLPLAYTEVFVADTDGDGLLTVSDALCCAHDQYFEGGSEAGYGVENTQYGISLTKLWGVENGGSYGYYLNNSTVMSLAEEIELGDAVCAYAYADTTGFSDVYCYFDKFVAEPDENGNVTLTLTAASFDENFNPVTVPVENAEILFNGEDSGVKTSSDGSFTLNIGKNGGEISARSETQLLVPPVCMAVQPDAVEAVGSNAVTVVIIAAAAAALIAGVIIVGKKKGKK